MEKTHTEHFDVVIIGGGPGGISAASKLALGGKRAVIINEGPLMGYGIDGAFRSKAGFEISREYLHTRFMEDVYGTQSPLDIQRMQKGIDRSAAQLTMMLENRLQRLEIPVVKGHGEFVDPNTVSVGNVHYHGDFIIIATGTTPRVLPGMELDGRRVVSSDNALYLQHTPASMLILGAGVIGCEFASLFNALGTEVHLLDTQPKIMSNEDADISLYIKRAFEKRDIKVIPSSRYQSMEVLENSVRTQTSTGEIETEMVLLAIGRSACSDSLNLDAAGIELDKRRYISTELNTRTTQPHIFAVGDIGNRNVSNDLALVHVAEAEGRCAAAQILGTDFRQSMDHIPYIIFTIPMLAGAGISEEFAVAKYGSVRIGKYPIARNHRAQAAPPPLGFVKLIVGPEGDDRILGVRIIGQQADTIAGAASIMIEQGLPYTYLLEAIFPHPSLLECLQGAAHIIAGDGLSYEEGEEFSLSDMEMPKIER